MDENEIVIILNNIMERKILMLERYPYYYSTWFVLLMLVLVFPVGLVLMWKGNKFGKVSRTIITVAGLSLLQPAVMKKAKQLLLVSKVMD